MRKRSLCAAVVCGVVGLSLAACVPDVGQDQQQLPAEQAVDVENVNEIAKTEGLAGIYEYMDQKTQDYAPKITTLEDGRQVQRTPESGEDSVFPGAQTAYNTFSLNADNRGCDSCHSEGLAEVVANMTYKHFPLSNGMGTNVDVETCLPCHNESDRMMHGLQNQFGSLIHGIHSRESFKGDCMSCHSATADGEGMLLWDVAKYDVLSGISAVENVQGDFTYDQDVRGGNLANTWWPMGDSIGGIAAIEDTLDYGVNAGFEDKEPSQEEFDNWEITVSGMVDNPFTITLKELIEQAPSETFVSSEQCIINPPSGEFLSNTEVTGVPISWLLEKAGVQEGATTIMPYGADDCSGFANTLENLASEGGWIIYQVEGEMLDYMEGFPARVWFPDHSYPMAVRWISEIAVTDEEPHYNEGFGIAGVFGGAGDWIGNGDPTVEFKNKPNSAICNTPEGLIIPAGQPYTFEGYADAINEQVTAVEFSMDGGATWTSFDTSDSDKKKWVYWYFTFTPEDPGAYVLQVRAVSGDGRVQYYPDKVMVNAK
ncbi:MAG: molybdopterin-dependent oxidoreductase [Eggerthellaceae bacterium]|nr:molybdopterin-dependent oxidoreductase [Eggerthellaceae bacterium]